MKEDNGGDALGKRLQAHRKRCELWEKAVAEHLSYAPDGKLQLASRGEVWRKLEQSNPDWRELWQKLKQEEQRILQLESVEERSEAMMAKYTGDDISEQLEFENRLKLAAAFEERIKRALREKDHALFRNLADAIKLSDDQINLIPDSRGAILVAWRELGGLNYSSVASPTKNKVRQWVTNSYKKRGVTLSASTLYRSFHDPLIAALFSDEADEA